MLIKIIKYQDYNGESQQKEYMFNLNKSELMELEVENGEQGLKAFIEDIIKEKRYNELVAKWKRIILLAYGERSADGQMFVKTKEATEAFSQSAAFDELYFELSTNAASAADFINGIIPADLRAKMNAASENAVSLEG